MLDERVRFVAAGCAGPRVPRTLVRVYLSRHELQAPPEPPAPTPPLTKPIAPRNPAQGPGHPMLLVLLTWRFESASLSTALKWNRHQAGLNPS